MYLSVSQVIVGTHAVQVFRLDEDLVHPAVDRGVLYLSLFTFGFAMLLSSYVSWYDAYSR